MILDAAHHRVVVVVARPHLLAPALAPGRHGRSHGTPGHPVPIAVIVVTLAHVPVRVLPAVGHGQGHGHAMLDDDHARAPRRVGATEGLPHGLAVVPRRDLPMKAGMDPIVISTTAGHGHQLPRATVPDTTTMMGATEAARHGARVALLPHRQRPRTQEPPPQLRDLVAMGVAGGGMRNGVGL